MAGSFAESLFADPRRVAHFDQGGVAMAPGTSDVANAGQRATMAAPTGSTYANVFGGVNQPGFFGQGTYVPTQSNFNLPGFNQDTQQYQGLAQQALGMGPGPAPTAPTQMKDPLGFGQAINAQNQARYQQQMQQYSQQVQAHQAQQAQQNQFRDQQQSLAGNLFGELNGTLPSVAQQQLQQSTQNNVANAYAMAQSGNRNPAAARMAADQAAQVNQQGAGQAALLRAQEIQNAQGQLGNVIGTARGQDTGLFTAQNQAAQGYLGQNLQAQGLQQQGQEAYEQGVQGSVTSGNATAPGKQAAQGLQAGVGAIASMMPIIGGAGAKTMQMGQQMTEDGGGFSSAPSPMSSGLVQSQNTPALARGGLIPGHAAFGGNNTKNDTVPALLSPKEVVLPRSVTLAKDAPDKAKAFMEAVRRKHFGKGKKAA